MYFPTLESIATRQVITLRGDCSVREGARAMARYHVRNVVVLSGDGEYRVLRAADLVALRTDGIPFDTPLAALELPRVPTLPPDADVLQGIARMRDGVGYLCLTSERGTLVGIVSQSDLLSGIDPQLLTESQALGELMAGTRFLQVAAGDRVHHVFMRMRTGGQDAAVVLDGEEPVGILTRGDTVRLLAEDASLEGPVSEVMSAPLHTVPDSCTIQEALACAREKGYKRIVVRRRDGSLLGVVTQKYLLALFYNRWIGWFKAQNEELLRAQRALRAERDRLALVAGALAEGLVVTDAGGCIERINAAAAALLGVEAGTFMGRPLAELLPGLSHCVEACPGGPHHPRCPAGPLELRRADASCITVHLRCRPLMEAGRYAGAVVFLDRAGNGAQAAP
ncbi:CBS domain-containing protein [Ectothiorhodospira mobilis]|uniref:CBS domain-containing protein n=1 Tax=Ectothiorhodospira mobilis TaxID=195064 RepID=UPI00190585BD|nr:CBS domain-containing protein [Ectothiorhodospira mobilis]